MGTRSITKPDQIIIRKRDKKRAEVEQRIMEVEFWLISFPATHPDWSGKVSELHALSIQLAQLNNEKSDYGFEATSYRIVV